MYMHPLKKGWHIALHPLVFGSACRPSLDKVLAITCNTMFGYNQVKGSQSSKCKNVNVLGHLV